jgi:type II secretory pathway pseudopilin PulG
MLKTIFKNQFRVGDQKGFTFIELISMMVIMSMMVSVAIKKLDLISDSASITALQSGIRELNTRETVAWAKIKLNDTGYTIDADVYNTVDKIISQDYSWNPGPDISGGRLHFKSQFVDLSRTPSTVTSVGSWH